MFAMLVSWNAPVWIVWLTLGGLSLSAWTYRINTKSVWGNR